MKTALARVELSALSPAEIQTMSKNPDGAMVLFAAANWAGQEMAFNFTRSTAQVKRLHAMTGVALNVAAHHERLQIRHTQALDDAAKERAGQYLPNGARYITCKPMTGCHHDEDEGFRWVIGHNPGAVQPWVVWVMNRKRECECGCYFDCLSAAAEFFDNNCE